MKLRKQSSELAQDDAVLFMYLKLVASDLEEHLFRRKDNPAVRCAQ